MYLINVLLSTYNGEKYISQLIESVLNQKNVNVILSVRDDGSSDATVDIIKSFNDSRIKFKQGKENLGAARSFLTMLKEAEPTDYYAYCDQDDVWNEDKLYKAAEMLRTSSEKPALFMSTYDVVDSNLNFLYKRDMEFEKPFCIETTLMFRSPSACVMVMNNALKDYINSAAPQNLRMHDFWTLLVALAVKADIYTLDESLLKYRIHGDNTVGLESNYFKKIKKLISNAVENKNERTLQAKSLYDCYKELLDAKTLKKLQEVIFYHESIKNKLKLLKDKDFRWSPYIDAMFYIAVILGVF